PVLNAVMLCRSYIPYGYRQNGGGGKEMRDGHFELPGCDPDKAVEVFFLDPKNQLGARVEFAPGQIGPTPVTVQLPPCGSAKARFVNEDGQPIARLLPTTLLLLTPGDTSDSISLDNKEPAADYVFLANIDRDHHGSRNLATDANGGVVLQ